jgi:hypothetical protein
MAAPRYISPSQRNESKREAIMFARILLSLAIALGLVAIPSVPESISLHADNEAQEWSEFHALAVIEYEDEFTRIFESLEFKRAKNGAPMIRREGETTFRFVARAK